MAIGCRPASTSAGFTLSPREHDLVGDGGHVEGVERLGVTSFRPWRASISR
jgi:hypothetical protein